MLSPSMSTKSNGNDERDDTSCRATSYCGGSPVPLSPMTANLSESAACGSAPSTPAWSHATAVSAVTIAATYTRTSSMGLIRAPPRRAAETPAHCKFLSDGADESRRDVRVIAAGAKSVLPLAITQSVEKMARPGDVLYGDLVAQEFAMPALVMKL